MDGKNITSQPVLTILSHGRMGSPEKPALIERFVRLIPLKYPLAALAWTIILGPIGFRIANFLQSEATPFQSPLPLNEFFGSLLAFYLYFIVRYLRLTVVKAEHLITPIMHEGEREYHSIFGLLTSNGLVLLVTIPLEALALLVANPYQGITVLSLYNAITQFILILAFATVIWEYSMASWGLHKLGNSQLNLKSFLEDRFMGAKSIGNVALSVTIAYLGALLFFFLDSATFLPVFSAGFAEFYLALLVMGVALFFLPLNSLHRRMQHEKGDYQRELNRRFVTLKQSTTAGPREGPASIERVENSIAELVRLKDLEITERRLASTPTWPFDIQVLARLILIVVSVTAALLSRIITNFLHI